MAVSVGDHRDGSQPTLLLRRIASYVALAEADVAALRQLEGGHVEVGEDKELIGEGDAYSRIYVIQKGWAIRHKSLPDGRRQIVNFILPGDFICLNASLFSRSHYAISTVTPAIVSSFDASLFRKLIDDRPRLAMAVAWCNAREEAMLIEHLTSLGRRTAYERLAHLILELQRRLELIGFGEEGDFDLPLTQAEIGDCMGLSIVHVSRTLQRLRRDGLIRLSSASRTVTVTNRAGLLEAAGFDDGYLYFAERSRMGHG